MGQYIALKVAEVVRETKDAVTIHFKQPFFKKIKYESGQFLTVIVEVNNTEYRRSYSLSTLSGNDKTLAVTVKRVEGGVVSNYLNESIEKGDTIQVMKPMGTFVLQKGGASTRNNVLCAGGSGITPLMSMLKNILFNESHSKVLLVYANREESSIIFKDKIRELASEYSNRFSFVDILSTPKETTEYTGRLTKDMLTGILSKNLDDVLDATYYMCGPEGFMESVENTLSALNVPENQVNKESFVAKVAQSAVSEEDIVEQTVTITIDGETSQVKVPAGTTILDAALDSGIDLPFSCQSGLCTACMCTKTSGEVSLGGLSSLSDAEIEEGKILTCVAKPLSEDVEIVV